MQQLHHKPTKLLIVGASGTGKTACLCRYLLAAPASRKFVFDHQGELAERLGLVACYRFDELQAAVTNRAPWIIFDPADSFSGDLEGGFAFFCDFAFSVAKAETGRKFFVSDEIQLCTNTASLPRSFKAIIETGRRAGLDTILISNATNLTNNIVRNNTTDLLAFRTIDPRALDLVEFYGLDAATVATLPDGKYIGKNTVNGSTYRGEIF